MNRTGISIITALAFLLVIATSASAKEYKQYQADWKPLHENKEAHNKWIALTKEYKATGMNKENIEARLNLIRPLVNKHPKWADGRWILANTFMQMGETVSADDEKGAKKSRAYLVEAKKHSETCLKLDPNLAICKFFLGASIGKIATIDGIVSSLSKGKKLLKLWDEVYESDQEYHFEDGYALQGLVRYALGVFYRVVPDFFLLRWVFGFSGDIDKSIQMHKESLTFKGGGGPCSQMMYAVAMLCKTGGEKGEEYTKEAFKVLKVLSKHPSQDESAQICIKDASRLMKTPDKACGYTKAKQQETDEAAMKAQLKK